MRGQTIVGLWRKTLRYYHVHGLPQLIRAAMARPWRPHAKASRDGPRRGKASGFDEQHGVDTASGRQLADLAGIVGPNWRHGNDYQPSQPLAFERLMQRLSIPHEQYAFIDLGSGKGRVLLMAARYPFARVVGVEYSRPLHEAAVRNLARCREGLRCGHVESLCMDAAAFVFPPQPSVVYMYNPFHGAIMERVVRNLTESLRRQPRPMYVLYYNPVHVDVFLDAGFRQMDVSVGTGLAKVLTPEFVNS